MFKLFTFIVLVIGFTNYRAQNLNLGFEDWTGGIPTDWFTSNLLNIYLPVSQSTDAHGGSYAVKGVVLPGVNNNGYSPLLAAGIDAKGFPVNYKISSLRGWYKFMSDSVDAFTVTAAVIKNNRAIGSGGYYNTQNQQVYTEFVANISQSEEVPDLIQITIVITNNQKLHVGSTFYVDDISFAQTTDVNQSDAVPGSFILKQNFPNPFNPTTTIQFEIPEDNFVSIRIFNTLGEEITTLVNNNFNKGKYRIDFNAAQFNLPSGFYFYQMTINSDRLQAGSYTDVKKMFYLK